MKDPPRAWLEISINFADLTPRTYFLKQETPNHPEESSQHRLPFRLEPEIRVAKPNAAKYGKKLEEADFANNETCYLKAY